LQKSDPKAAASFRRDMITEDMTAKRNAISSDDTVAPVATKKPLAAELPKDIQQLVDKKYK
jgi:hypothetical protein